MRRFDVSCLLPEDVSEVSRAAATVGSFIGSAMVHLLARSLCPKPMEITQEISIGDAARMLGVCVKTVRNRVEDGKIPARRDEHGRYRFLVSDLESYMEG